MVTVSYLPPKTGVMHIEAKMNDQLLPGFPISLMVSRDYSPDKVVISTVPDNNTFHEPYIAYPLRNSFLVADMKSSQVVEIDKATFDVIRIVAGGESEIKLNFPRAIAKMPKGGELLIVDSGNNRVLMLSADGNSVVRVIGSSPSGGNKDGEFKKPRGVLVLPDERILVCDTENCRFQIFDKLGRHLRSVGSRGQEERQFVFPLNAALSPFGDEIAVTDSDNFRVQFFDLNMKYLGEIGRGRVEVVAGEETHGGDDQGRGGGGGGNNNNKRKCELLTPIGVAYDQAGNLIVSELNGHRLRIFSREKHLISTIGAAGQQDHLFMKPRGVTVDEDGTIYVADTDNKAIKMIH
jgi:DNA-binding beta-propeller fold protein YncE